MVFIMKNDNKEEIVKQNELSEQDNRGEPND